MKGSNTTTIVAVVLALGAIGLIAYSQLGGEGGGPPDASPDGGSPRDSAAEEGDPKLQSIGPRLVSNQYDFPVTIYGQDFTDGMTLVLMEGGRSRTLGTRRIDEGRLAAVLPHGFAVEPRKTALELKAHLLTASGDLIPGDVALTVINDHAYPRPYAMAVSPDGDRLVVASPTTDTLHWLELSSGKTKVVPSGDGPRAAEWWTTTTGEERVVVVHENDDTVAIFDPDTPDKPLHTLKGPRLPQDLAIDATKGLAYVTGRLNGDVHVIDLAKREVTRRLEAGIDPRSLALGGDGRRLLVGNLGSSDLTAVELESGALSRISQDQDTQIIGGLTQEFQQYIMGGTAPRHVVYSPRLDVFFVSSVGPNIGPNPKRMEVSMNGGVGVVDASGRFVRHVSVGRGVPERMALDDGRGVLYVADIGMGRVLALDATRITSSPDGPSAVGLVALEIAPPDGTVFLRLGDLGEKGRATASLHSGTRVVRLSKDGSRLFALNSFTGTVSIIDTEKVTEGELTLSKTFSLVPVENQRQRRLGEVAYHTDVGNSRMSCDTCHYEGHSGGLLFTKNQPMHIYRSPSLRYIRESPPYFTPAQFPNLDTVGRIVLGRNRYHNPDPDPKEIKALSLYQASLTGPPNPYRDADGTLPETVELPDGQKGSPRAGLKLFFGEARCGTCHPAPHYTTDQDKETRGRLYKVGTPVALNLSRQWQDAAPYELPAPSLLGVWDNFPLLHSGAGGYKVVERGQVAASSPFALRRVMEMAAESGAHGEVKSLEAAQINDLLAFLMTL